MVDGVELQRLPKHRIAHAGLARTYQNIRLFDAMSVVKNLEVALVPPRIGRLVADTLGLTPRAAAEERRARCHAVLERLGLAAHAERPAGSLAYGQQSWSNWPGRWSQNRACCCWTSRPQGSPWRDRAAQANTFSTCAHPTSQWCSSSTT